MVALAREIEENQWVSADAARYICAEFYRGVTNRQWKYGKPAPLPVNLDVHRSVTLRSADRYSGMHSTVDVNGKNISIPIPDQVSNGQTLCFRNQGLRDSATGKTGDLYVTVYIQSATTTTSSWKKSTVVAAAALVLVLLILLIPKGNKNQEIQDNTPVQTVQKQDPPKVENSGQTAQKQETTHVHTWQEATYTAPRTCSGCGLTSGLSLGTPVIKCTEVDSSQCPEGTDITIGTLTDAAGVQHESSVMLWVNAVSGYVNTEHITYRLSGNYDELQGVIAVAKKSDSSAAVRFYFYGDGKMLYKTGYIRGTQTEKVQIDVSGVQELRIECETDEKCHGYGILDASLYVK
jgi:hypothetical protein